MLCPYCNYVRPDTLEACPRCQAPSPLAGNTNMMLQPYSAQLPVPIIRMPDFPTIHTGDLANPLLPALPDKIEPIHVLPMYTKPRPLIPRYRIISGFISFFVVIGLLCAGGLYYANATGRLSFIGQWFNPQFQNMQASPVVQLPTPTVSIVYGTASTTISSATTALVIDPKSSQPSIASNKFTVGKPIYVTYSVHANQAGVVTFKWYTAGLLYQVSQSQPIPPGKNGESFSGNTAVVYSRPAEGSVELYWNGQFAVRLYFVVEPDTGPTP